jgi:outer membrane protein OmpA-like peptidoglycan-associated protein
MHHPRTICAAALGPAILATAGCASGPPPPPPMPVVRPAIFTPMGVSAPYLSADVVGGRQARARKMRAAGITPLTAATAGTYLAETERELRVQTAGIGVDIVRIGDGLLIRIPAAFTFNAGSSEIRPQFDATLTEIARTVKARPKTYVDVFAHTDTTGTPQVNQALSDKRATAVAAFLGRRGVARARIASKGFGESAPLFVPDDTETQRAANRRLEIRLMPYRATDAR